MRYNTCDFKSNISACSLTIAISYKIINKQQKFKLKREKDLDPNELDLTKRSAP